MTQLNDKKSTCNIEIHGNSCIFTHSNVLKYTYVYVYEDFLNSIYVCLYNYTKTNANTHIHMYLCLIANMCS